MRIADERLAGLLKAVVLEPADDARRLVYADALDDAGCEARAEFVRVQVDMATMQEAGIQERADAEAFLAGYERLLGRERQLLDVAAAENWAGLPGYVLEWTWRRGFVDAVRTSPADWLDHWAALLELAPLLTTVLLTENPSVTYFGGKWTWQASLLPPGGELRFTLGNAVVGKQLFLAGKMFDDAWSHIRFVLP